MSLRRARTADEYVNWIKNAVFEVGDLKDCMLYEIEDMTRFPSWLQPLEESINQVYQSMQEGSYRFGREDLPYMEILRVHGDRIPFYTLLEQINETHRKGLEVEDEE